MDYHTMLVDASHLAYRTFFALPPLSFHEDNTQMIYGFLSSLTAMMKRQPVKQLVIVLDRGHKAKDEVYPDYKKREPDKDPLDADRRLDFRTQFEKLEDFLKWLGIKMADELGAEADDVIASLCTQRKEIKMFYQGQTWYYDVEPPILILSGDHDLNSLISDDVSLLKPNKGEIYDIDKFREEFPGLEPWQYKEMMAFTGCSGDNVPGVKGIGPKYAADLIRKYGSVSGVGRTKDESRIIKLAHENWKDVVLSQRLVAFEDVPDESYILYVEDTDLAKVRRNLFALGMESLIEAWPDVVKLTEL